jgi:hypothetical protein
MVPLVEAKCRDVLRWTHGSVLEVVAAMGVGLLLEAHNTWKRWNRHTDGRTHTYIS